MKAIEIELHPNSRTRVNGFCLSKSQKTLICSLKNHRKPPSQKYWDGVSTGPYGPGLTAHIQVPTMVFLAPITLNMEVIYSSKMLVAFY